MSDVIPHRQVSRMFSALAGSKVDEVSALARKIGQWQVEGH
jgi:hypothetical protein